MAVAIAFYPRICNTHSVDIQKTTIATSLEALVALATTPQVIQVNLAVA